MLIGLVFLTIGLFMSGLYFKELWSWWSTQSWVEVSCSIDGAELKARKSSGRKNRSKKTIYKVEANYHYDYEGRTYKSDRITYSAGSDNFGSFQQVAAAELKRHVQSQQPFRCFVNSQHPEQAVLYRQLRQGALMLLIIFPLGFPAIGVFTICVGWRNWIQSRAMMKLRAEYPDEPGRWNPEWADGILRLRDHSKAMFMYIAWSGLLILPIIIASSVSGLLSTNSGLWIWLLVILWAIAVWHAFRNLRQRLLVGSISFKPEIWPISQTTGLRGQVMFSRQVSLRNPIEITVSCVKEFIRRPVRKPMKQTEPLWSSSESIDGSKAICDLSGTRVPLFMALPHDAPDSTIGYSDVTYVWKLKMQSKDTCINASFDLPVFHTAAGNNANSSIEEIVAPITCLQVADDKLKQDLVAAGLQVSFTPDEMPESIVCPPGRYQNFTSILVVLNFCWTGYFVYLLMSEAPRLLSLPCAVSVAAGWFFILYMSFIRRCSTFSNEGVEIESGIKWLWRRRKFHPRNTLLNFTCAANMNTGDISYFDVKITTMSGLKGKVADMIPTLAMAEALVQRLEKWRTSP